VFLIFSEFWTRFYRCFGSYNDFEKPVVDEKSAQSLQKTIITKNMGFLLVEKKLQKLTSI
jgi:hypothetical protein